MNKIGVTGKTRTTSSVQIKKKQLQGLKHQIEQLGQFVIRLSKHYEGVTPTLDKELQVLRSHLGGNANFSLAEVSMGKLTGLIMQNSDSIRKQNSKTLGVLESAIKQLQREDTVAEDVKGEAAKFLNSLQSDNSSLFSTLPHFETALSIYKRALKNVSALKRERARPSPSEETLEINARLHEEISHELRELIDQLSLTRKKDKQLREVKSQLVKGLDHDALLECCLVIIKAIIRDVVTERKHAEKFVTGLHKSLSTVNANVGQTIEDTEEQYQLKASANEHLREHLVNMENAVETSTDLAQLKAQASEYLAKMSASLGDREKADKGEQMILMNLLNEMKTQLTNLEQETADYKHRLIEQKYHSHHDPLTQVPNRTAYNERVEMEFRRWKRHKGDLCMAVIDVDHFKSINDNYGHAGGDKTLQVIAQNISRCLRSTDFLARWGGEEFVVLFPETSLGELNKPLEAIRRQVEKIPFKFKEKKVTITVSIGASSFAEGDSIETVFERADSGLYEAKNAGRNRCIIKAG